MRPSSNERISEIVLILVLLLLLSFVRVYYGGSPSLIVVWKEKPAFADTLVNLPQVLNLTTERLKKDHPSVYWQLIAMEILADHVELESSSHNHQSIQSKRKEQLIKHDPVTSEAK